MTKTYLIEKDYGRDLRVSVGDDVHARVQYSERPDIMVVTFERHSNSRYETETVVAFSNVTKMRLQDDDVVVEEKQIDWGEVAAPKQAIEANPIETWVRS